MSLSCSNLVGPASTHPTPPSTCYGNGLPLLRLQTKHLPFPHGFPRIWIAARGGTICSLDHPVSREKSGMCVLEQSRALLDLENQQKHRTRLAGTGSLKMLCRLLGKVSPYIHRFRPGQSSTASTLYTEQPGGVLFPQGIEDNCRVLPRSGCSARLCIPCICFYLGPLHSLMDM